MHTYQALAREIQRLRNLRNMQSVMADDVELDIERFVKINFPSGSGFDSGTTIDLDECKEDKLVFNTSFHHMNDHGYTCWTNHKVIVTPSLSFGCHVTVKGRNLNDIKDYIHDQFSLAVEALIDPYTISPVKPGKEKP